MAMPAFRSSDVRLTILFQGQSDSRLYILPANEYERFEAEYKTWQSSAHKPAEFTFTQQGQQIFFRLDPILTREVITQAQFEKAQRQSWNLTMESLTRSSSNLSISEMR